MFHLGTGFNLTRTYRVAAGVVAAVDAQVKPGGRMSGASNHPVLGGSSTPHPAAGWLSTPQPSQCTSTRTRQTFSLPQLTRPHLEATLQPSARAEAGLAQRAGVHGNRSVQPVEDRASS